MQKRPFPTRRPRYPPWWRVCQAGGRRWSRRPPLEFSATSTWTRSTCRPPPGNSTCRCCCSKGSSVVLVLVQYSISGWEIYLPSPPSWMFGEEGPKNVFERLCSRLQTVEEGMEERNKRLKVPHTILLPSKIPAGISIWSFGENDNANKKWSTVVGGQFSRQDI